MKCENRKDNLLICPNPVAIAPASQCNQGGLIPGEIHGCPMMQEAIQLKLITDIPVEEIKDFLPNAKIENDRFNLSQFSKNYDAKDMIWCAIQMDGQIMSVANVQPDYPFRGYFYINEVQTIKKGFGKPLLIELCKKYGKVWLMSNPHAEGSLLDYYRTTKLFDEICVEDSIYDCPEHFFCTSQCDYDKLEGYCQTHYGKQSHMDESIEKESSIDYPVSKGLCEEIWVQDEQGNWKIDESIKQRALELVDKLLARYHVKATGVNVVGSICSNQYTSDSDVDVHIQVDLPNNITDKLNNLRKKEQDILFKGEDLMVGNSKTHPLEFYFQSNIYGDMGSCGCYDLMNDEWMSGPQFVDMEFDPFDEYCQSFEEAIEFGHRVSNALFDVQKSLYKYNAILDHASNEDVFRDDQMMGLIGRRLDEVVEEVIDGMRVVSELKEEMVQIRKRANVNPSNEDEANEMRTDKEWLSANSTFKFLQRMDVLDSCWGISDLYSSYANGEIDAQVAVSELNNEVGL